MMRTGWKANVVPVDERTLAMQTEVAAWAEQQMAREEDKDEEQALRWEDEEMKYPIEKGWR